MITFNKGHFLAFLTANLLPKSFLHFLPQREALQKDKMLYFEDSKQVFHGRILPLFHCKIPRILDWNFALKLYGIYI